jgi:nitrogen fixation NifU-like protein
MEDYEHLMDYYKHPKYRGSIAGSYVSSVDNISCGDKITLYLKVSDSGRIEEAKYNGSGCVLSMAGAEILCKYLTNKNVKKVCKMTFQDLITLVGFTPSINRSKCIGINLDALKGICKKRRYI